MQYKDYYLLDAEFQDNHQITGQIDGVVYSSLADIESQLGIALPTEPSEDVYINNLSIGEWEQGMVPKTWGAHHAFSMHPNEENQSFALCKSCVTFTVRTISVPVEEPQFDEYELRVIRNSLLAYHHVLSENHDESSYIYKAISMVEELQDKLSSMIVEIEEE